MKQRPVRLARRCAAPHGEALPSDAWSGRAQFCEVERGWLGCASPGNASRGVARPAERCPAQRGPAMLGLVRRGQAGMAVHFSVQQRRARHCIAVPGSVEHSSSRLAWPGSVWQGRAWRSTAAQCLAQPCSACRGWRCRVRHGSAEQRCARHGWLRLARLCAVWSCLSRRVEAGAARLGPAARSVARRSAAGMGLRSVAL